MDDILERLTRLETLHIVDSEKMNEAIEKIDKINHQLTQYHGFIGGIIFICTGLGIALEFFKTWLDRHFA